MATLRKARVFGLVRDPAGAFALCCGLLLALAGCYDVVPSPDKFGTAGEDAAAAKTDSAVIDSAVVDSSGLDTLPSGDVGASGDGGAPDAAADVATVDGGDTTVADVPLGKVCSQDLDCGKVVNGCAFAQCVKGHCQQQIKADGAICNNGDPCMQDMTCKAGVCQGGSSVVCECKTSKDCVTKNGGNKCLGEFYCDTSGKIPSCKVNPVTVPKCPDAKEGGCIAEWACVPATGACAAKLKPNIGPDAACDDGDLCTSGDHCVDGLCYPGSLSVCGCKKDADCVAKSSVCGGKYYCDTLSTTPSCKLIPGSPVVCDTSEDGACAATTCNETTGACEKKPLAKPPTSCDDGDPCTKSGTCDPKTGACISGVNTCVCTKDADCAKFDDGDLCNGTLYCDTTLAVPACKPNPATVKVCPTAKDTTCQKNTCQKLTGKCEMIPAKLFSSCDADGNPCTKGDWCDGTGACKPGTNTCTCTKDADCAGEEDGDLCTGTLFCDKSAATPTCKVNPKTVVSCPGDGNPCTAAVCDAKTGKCANVNIGNDKPCDDGDSCTAPDLCQKGTCVPGTDKCTCKQDSDCHAADLCLGVPFCDKSTKPYKCSVIKNTAVTCAKTTDGSCFASTCDPLTGACTSEPSDGLCKDADKNPCTIEFCDAKSKSCGVKTQPDGAACGTDKVCATGKCIPTQPNMVLIPAGKGWAGCTDANLGPCPAETLPAKEVTLKAVFIDRYEVTVAQYKACVDGKKCVSQPGKSTSACNWSKTNLRPKHPMNCLSWSQADEYCKAQGKRLPTEAEWERAARGGCDQALGSCQAGTRVYPWGNDVASCFWAVMQNKTGDGCGLGTTREVGTYQKDRSPYLVQDMSGNVAEWVLDTWDPKALTLWSASNPLLTGGSGHTVKGGHLSAGTLGMRAFSRGEGKSGATVGFRCVRDL